MARLLTSNLEWKRPSMVSGYVLNVKKQHHSSFVDRMKHAHNTVNKYRQNIDHTNKWQTQEPYYTEVLERQTRDSSRRSGKLLVEVHAIIRSFLYRATTVAGCDVSCPLKSPTLATSGATVLLLVDH